MTADEFFKKLGAKLETPVDNDGKPIEELAGLLLKQLDVVDMMAVQEYAKKHGEMCAWEAMLARGLRNADGTQVVPDDKASGFRGCLNVPLKRAVEKIRVASGYGDDEPADPDALGVEKKTSLTESQNSKTSSALPDTSKRPRGKS